MVIKKAAPRTARVPRTKEAEPADDFNASSATTAFNTAIKALSEAAKRPRTDIPDKATKATILADAEKARSALSWMRLHEKELEGVLPPQQLETGMLALISKCIANSLYTTAWKELVTLKKRLDKLAGVVAKRLPTAKKVDLLKKQSVLDSETICELLNTQGLKATSTWLAIIASAQTHVFKLLALRPDPALVEASIPFLDLDDSHCIWNLIIVAASSTAAKQSCAKQLDALSHVLLSICPSTSTSEDSNINASKTSPDSATAFQLQIIALRLKKKWWDLAGHSPDDEKEIWTPLHRYTSTLLRRTTDNYGQAYGAAKAGYQMFCTSQSSALFTAQRSILKLLSAAARKAGAHAEAIEWLTRAEPGQAADTSVPLQCATALRLAIVAIESDKSDAHSYVTKAIEGLEGCKQGDSLELDEVLIEVSSFRKVAIRLVAQDGKMKPSQATTLEQPLHLASDIVTACTRFLLRYIARSSAQTQDQSSIQRTEASKAIIMKLSPSFIEATILITHQHIKTSLLDFDRLDMALQLAAQVYNTLELSQSSHASLAVKLSTMYLNIYAAEARQNEGNDASVLKSLARSVEVLRPCASTEKHAGSIIGKMEKPAKSYLSFGHTERAMSTCEDAIRELLRVDDVIESLGTNHDIAPGLRFAQDRLLTLPRLLSTLSRMSADQRTSNLSEMIVRLADQLAHSQRAAFLELAMMAHRDLVVGRSPIPQMAIESYTKEGSTVAAMRVALFCALHGEAVDLGTQELGSQTASHATHVNCRLETDRRSALHKYYTSSLRTLSCLASNDIGGVRSGVEDWEGLLRSPANFQLLSETIALSQWIQTLEAVAAFAASRGLSKLATVTLTLLTKLINNCQGMDGSELILAYTRLAAQLLSMGHSSKAGAVLARAGRCVDTGEATTLAQVQQHLAHADYQLRIGSPEGATISLQLAAGCTAQDPAFFKAARGSSSNTAATQQVMAQAWIIYSRLLTEDGNITAALDYARRSTKLAQRLWMTIETDMGSTAKVNAQRIDSPTEPQIDAPILSRTHNALRSAALWPLVPTIIDAFMNLAKIYAHIGSLADATSWADQAKRVAAAVENSRATAAINCFLNDCYISATKMEKAQACLDEAWACKDELAGSPELVLLHASMALMWRAGGEYEDEEESYAAAHAELKRLHESEGRVDSYMDVDTELAELATKMAITDQIVLPASKAPKKSVRKVTPTTAGRQGQAMTKKVKEEPTVSTVKSIPLVLLEGQLLRSQAESLLAQDKSAKAAKLVEKAESLMFGRAANVHQKLMMSNGALTEGLMAMQSDFTFGVLPESTISLPATSGSTVEPIVAMTVKPVTVKAMKTTRSKMPAKAATGKKGKQPTAEVTRAFVGPLVKAQEGYHSSFVNHLHLMSARVAHHAARSLRSVSVMLSAVRQTPNDLYNHPLFATAHFESLQLQEDQRAKSISLIENTKIDKDTVLAWPTLPPCIPPPTTTLDIEALQHNLIDIIPPTWAAISISLDATKQDLLLTRYEANSSPFILRLPLSRHKSHLDIDSEDDVFDVLSGRSEMLQIIDLANFSAHDAGNVSQKQGKLDWWAAREALDNRLRDLLVNMENIWLGGFRGIFSEQRTDSQLLANFQQALRDIVKRYLPSRKGRAAAGMMPLDLDSRVLQLFTGLGDPSDETLDLDEPLLDLLYFVVDILQFSGERNAYDEIDFDAMVVETIDALKIYHGAAVGLGLGEKRHTVLVLDKEMHLFPWESLPCLQKASVSRLPTLVALQTRLLAAREAGTSGGGPVPAGHHVSRSHGHSILNPGGDLANTQAALQPCLHTLPALNWTHSTTAPTEPDLSSLVSTQDLLLYFGHGSGAQYIRPRTVKKQPRAPLTWLMGCSSSATTDNGDFQSDGMVLAYLQAGAPAVLGTLWDVTDRDCDRASVEIGEKWGLWQAGVETRKMLEKGRYRKKSGREVEVARAVAPLKTPGRKRARADDVKTPGVKARSASREQPAVSLSEAVVAGREACYLRYLNGAAFVVYGIPAYLTK